MTQLTASEKWPGNPPAGISVAHRVSAWSFGRNIAILGGGTAVAQLINIALAPLLTRLYTPGSLGQYGLFASFLNVALVVVSLKYELSILAVTSEQTAAQLALASFLFALPMSLLSAGLLYVLIHYSFLGFGAVPTYAAVVMGAVLVLGAAFYILRYWFIRLERFGYLSQATVAQNGVRSVSQVIAGAFGAAFGGLVGGELLGRCAGMAKMLRDAWPVIRNHSLPLDHKTLREALRENWQFPIYSFPSSLVDSLSVNITIPLIVFYYGQDAGGYFALVQRVLAVPIVFVSASVADAFHGRLALYARDMPDRVPKFFRKTSAGLLGLGAIPAIVLFLFGVPLFRIFFGAQWITAGKLAALITPLFLAQFVVSPLSRLVFVLRGQAYKLIFDGMALGNMIGVFLYASWRHLSLLHAIFILSLTGTLTYVVYYLILVWVVAKHQRSFASAAS